jgi:hypothetical protein
MCAIYVIWRRDATWRIRPREESSKIPVGSCPTLDPGRLGLHCPPKHLLGRGKIKSKKKELALWDKDRPDGHLKE